MNTNTMRLPPRRVLMPTKRKERDDIDPPKPTTPTPTKLSKPSSSFHQAGSKNKSDPDHHHLRYNNLLLAGYLAHEYISKGTIFGQPFDPATTEDVKAEPSERGSAEPMMQDGKYQKYVEISRLMKTDGVHMPGIVNPTQLSRLLQM